MTDTPEQIIADLRAAMDYALSEKFDEALDALDWLHAWRAGDKRRAELRGEDEPR